MEPIRCHFTIVFERVFRVYRNLLPAFLIPVLAGDFTQRIGLFVAAIAVIFVIFSAIFTVSWLKTRLSADDRQIYVTSGVLWRKQLTIPFDRINTVDLSRNLFQRIVGTCRIKIDTGAVSGKAKGDAESDLVFSLADAERIRSLILSLRGGVASLHDEFVDVRDNSSAAENWRPIHAAGGVYRRRETPIHAADPASGQSVDSAGTFQAPQILFRAQTRDFFLYGLTQNKLLAGAALAFSLLATAEEILGDPFLEWAERIGLQAGALLSRFELAAVVLSVFLLFLLYYLIANVISILTAVVRFFGFRVSRAGDMLHIEYGLISVRSYTMPIRNIHAVIVKQNLLRQWLRQCTVELVSIGYGDDKNEVALLLPMIRLSALDATLARILPEYAGERTRAPAPARARIRFLFWPVLLLTAVSAIAALFLPELWFSLAVTVPLMVWARLLAHRHAGIAYAADRIDVSTGGFNRHEYRIRMAAVQSVGGHSTWLSERAGLLSYRIDYHAPAMRAVAHVRFLEEKHLDTLRELLDT